MNAMNVKRNQKKTREEKESEQASLRIDECVHACECVRMHTYHTVPRFARQNSRPFFASLYSGNTSNGRRGKERRGRERYINKSKEKRKS